ncbi:hypothetical protein DOTSEDRAFT_33422 [Dothistroma septosporum NZE10]|uniref:Uncharacterized protein n=1 Tax=Dothistroma septosporum (strain NZE10 / CBS 128990) TaxID=675120 RepID=N1PU36_DOTSN|nr:hypothetical protein DOTSEDRAFT_33422 [Dothistroma septosporum NZE10]
MTSTVPLDFRTTWLHAERKNQPEVELHDSMRASLQAEQETGVSDDIGAIRTMHRHPADIVLEERPQGRHLIDLLASSLTKLINPSSNGENPAKIFVATVEGSSSLVRSERFPSLRRCERICPKDHRFDRLAWYATCTGALPKVECQERRSRITPWKEREICDGTRPLRLDIAGQTTEYQTRCKTCSAVPDTPIPKAGRNSSRSRQSARQKPAHGITNSSPSTFDKNRLSNETVSRLHAMTTLPQLRSTSKLRFERRRHIAIQVVRKAV